MTYKIFLLQNGEKTLRYYAMTKLPLNICYNLYESYYLRYLRNHAQPPQYMYFEILESNEKYIDVLEEFENKQQCKIELAKIISQDKECLNILKKKKLKCSNPLVYNKERYQMNKEKFKEYYNKNKEHRKEYQNKRYKELKNKQEVVACECKIKRTKKHSQDKECLNIQKKKILKCSNLSLYNKERYKLNKEKYKEYYNKNKEHQKEYQNKRYKELKGKLKELEELKNKK